MQNNYKNELKKNNGYVKVYNNKPTDVIPLYPIVTYYNIKNDSIMLNLINSNSKIKENMTYKYYNYNVNYQFPHEINKQLSLLSHFVDIIDQPTFATNNAGSIGFHIDINSITSMDFSFKNIILEIFDKISKHILKEHPNLTAEKITYPYITDINMNKNLKVEMASFNEIINCPIHFHRSKAKGGEVITIKEKTQTDMMIEIKREMPMFKISSYSNIFSNKKEPELDDKIIAPNVTPERKKIYYEGKFILSFSVTVISGENIKKHFKPEANKNIKNKKDEIIEDSDDDDNQDKDDFIWAKVIVSTKEIEIKYNTTYVKSVLDKSIETIKTPFNNLKTIQI